MAVIGRHATVRALPKALVRCKYRTCKLQIGADLAELYQFKPSDLAAATAIMCAQSAHAIESNLQRVRRQAVRETLSALTFALTVDLVTNTAFS